MIRLSNIDGYPLFINPSEISSILALRPGPYTAAIIHMRNGVKHEVRETADRIETLLREASRPPGAGHDAR